MIDIFLLTIFISIFVLLVSIITANTIIKRIPSKGQIKSFISTLESLANAYLYRSYGVVFIVSLFIALFCFVFVSMEASAGFLIGTITSILCSYFGSMFFYRIVGRLEGSVKEKTEKKFDIAFIASSVLAISVFALVLFEIGITYIIFAKQIDALVGMVLGYSLPLFFIKMGGGVLQEASQENINDVVDISKRAISTVSFLVSKGINCGGVALDSAQSFIFAIGGMLLMSSFLFEEFADIHLIIFLAGIVSVISAILFAFILKSYDFISSVGSIYFVIAGAIITNALLFLGASYGFFNDVAIEDKAILYSCLVMGMMFSGFVALFYYYYTAVQFSPIKSIMRFSLKGGVPAFVSSMSIGFESAIMPALSTTIVFLISYLLGDIYGVLATIAGFFMIMPVLYIFNFFALLAPSIADVDDKSEHKVVKFLDNAKNISFAITKGYGVFVGCMSSVVMIFAIGYYILFENPVKEIFLVDSVYFLSGVFIGFCCVFLFASVIFRSIIRISNNVLDRMNSYKININSNNTQQFIWITNLMRRSVHRDSIYSILLLIVFTPLFAVILREQALLGFVSGVVACGFLLSFFLLIMGVIWSNARSISNNEDISSKDVDKKEVQTIAKSTNIFQDSLSEIIGLFVKTVSSMSFLLISLI